MNETTARGAVDPAGALHPMRRRIDPGTRAMLVAVLVMGAVLALLLPWAGGMPGWQVLAGTADPGPLPTLFSWTLTAFAVAASGATLLTRLWVLAWLAAIGNGISAVTGLWAIWSVQTGGAGAPGAGLLLGVPVVVVLTFTWAGTALRRS